MLKSVRSLNQILWKIRNWFKALECQISWTNTKLFLWEREANLGTLQKLFTYIGVSYQFVLKSLKTLIWIFLAMEYCFRALECQLSLMNAKSFFWENVANRKTLQNLSSYVGISYKFFLKSVKSLNPLFWVIKYWFKAFEYQIWSTNTKSLSEEVRQTLELFKSFLPTLQFPTNLFWSLSKASIESSVWSNIRLRVYNDKNCRRIQAHFSGKLRPISKLCKSFVLMLEFPINSFWSLSKA